MVKCARCYLHIAMMGMNVLVNLCGVGMILYSLWLEKKWYVGVSELPTKTNVPRPWFIYTCLSVGMAVCLSTIFGHMIANCFSNSALCIYVVSLSSLLFLEVAVLVLIFFRMDWTKLIAEYIDENHQKFKAFVVFHIAMCRLILILILVLQIIVVVFAVILWLIGTEPRTGHRISAVPDFKQSFLVWPNSPLADESVQNQNGSSSIPLPVLLEICTRCGEFCRRNSGEGILSFVKGVIRTRFRRRTIDN